jgi:hypothetical protein
MARIAWETKTTNTTQAEQAVLDFLYQNKGVEYTAEQIEEATGIRADLIYSIMDNLRWKGFEVASEPNRGVHYFIHNTIWSYLIGAGLIGFILIMLFFGWLNYLDTCPGCPPDDVKQEMKIQEFEKETGIDLE